MINKNENILEYLEGEKQPNALSIANARAIASRQIQTDVNLYNQCLDSGLLGEDELQYLLETHLYLPFPYIPNFESSSNRLSSPENYLFSDAFYDSCIKYAKEGNPVYFVSGNFSLFTAAHLNLIVELEKKCIEDRKNKKRSLIAVLIENNSYSPLFKSKQPLIPSVIRAGWFRDFPNTISAIWPFDYSIEMSPWSTGINDELGMFCNQGDIYMFNSLSPEQRANISMVIPQYTTSRNEDLNLAQLREKQLIGSGFSIYKPEAKVCDTTTSVLAKRFNIKPLSSEDISLVLKKKKQFNI